MSGLIKESPGRHNNVTPCIEGNSEVINEE